MNFPYVQLSKEILMLVVQDWGKIDITNSTGQEIDLSHNHHIVNNCLS